jgi:hypothetical protein
MALEDAGDEDEITVLGVNTNWSLELEAVICCYLLLSIETITIFACFELCF